jgi:AmmeMemoRadiSam system protein A
MSFLPESFAPEEQSAMLALARSAIVAALENKPLQLPQPEPPCLTLRRGVFVTVHVSGKLRGCIGVIEGREPLSASIPHCAQGAALHDPRFSPLRASELGELQIEISVLSELHAIAADQAEIGKHGLFVVAGDQRGLLLPQVAIEHHLSRVQFLEETCRKAGLPRDAWRKPETQLFGFTCEIFHENTGAASAR